MSHLTDEQLAAQIDAASGAPDATAAARHLAECESCRARLTELAKENETVQRQISDRDAQLNERNAQLETANAQIAQLTGHPQPAPLPTPKPNWVDERHRNYNSSLNNPASGNRRAVITTPSIIVPVPGPRTYYNDFKGSYWIDSGGSKIYVR